MHQKCVLMGLVAASLAVTGCSGLPSPPGQENAADPPAYVNVVRTEEIQVRLVPQNAAGALRNQHPAAFRPEQLDALLSSLRVRTEDRPEAGTLTSLSRLDALSAGISKALARANPGQDVAFVVFRRGGGGFFSGTSRYVTTGRAFYRNDTLNVIFGEFDAPYSEFRDVTINAFDFGSRDAQADVGGDRLIANGTWQWHEGRQDWIEMEATPQAIESAASAAPQVIESSAGSSARPMDYGPAAANTRPARVQSESTPRPASGAQSSDTGRSAPATAADDGWSRIEDRLTRLKRLRDKNLISDRDYQHKKEELLQQLP